MKQLTDRQQQVFAFIKDFIAEHGWAPTYVDIGKHFGFSARAGFGIVRVLARKGVIERVEGVPRGIKVREPLRIYQAITDAADGSIREGDYVHTENGRVTGITRLFKEQSDD